MLKLKIIMKVSIIGNGLTSLTLANMLVKQNISVDIFYSKKIKNNNKIQTLGISKTNIDFFINSILDIKKLMWNIDKIEIYSERLKNEKILNFEDKRKTLFSIIKNCDLYNILYENLKKNKLIRFKKKLNYKNLKKNNYKLIFNCENSNFISRKFFFKKIKKNYDSKAYVTTFTHKKLLNNHSASQIFTKRGPLAFYLFLLKKLLLSTRLKEMIILI